MSADEERLTYTVDEAAALLGISRRHGWRLIAQGPIPVVRLGHRTLISRAALQAVLNAPEQAERQLRWASKRNAVEPDERSLRSAVAARRCSDASAEGGRSDALLRVITQPT